MRIAKPALPRLFFAALLGCCCAVGCGDSASSPDTGTVQLHVTSAPSGDYKAVHLDVLRVDGLLTDENGQKGWVIIGTPNRTIDLVQGAPIDVLLPSQRAVPAGHFEQVRLTLGPRSTINLQDGSLHALSAPSDSSTGIKLSSSFDVAKNAAAEGSLRFDGVSAVQTGHGAALSLSLQQNVQPLNLAKSGTISGTINVQDSCASLAGVALFGEEVDASGRATIISTAVTDDQGAYTMPLLPLGHTYYVVTRPYVNGTIYDPQASSAMALSTKTPIARYNAALGVSSGVGGVSGQVLPISALNESDQLNLVRQFSPSDKDCQGGQSETPGASLPWLIVDLTIGQLATAESYAFSSVPLGHYAVSGTRSTVQLDGTVSVTGNATSMPFDVIAGSTVNADVSYP